MSNTLDAFKSFVGNDSGKRKRLINEDVCPECFGELDTGWECNACGYDARQEAYSEIDKAREKKKRAHHN